MKDVKSMYRGAVGAVSVAMVAVLATHLPAAEPEMVDVFARGTNGYHTYCIPSLICTAKGTLLAFCEGRKINGIDESPTDLVLRRSFDGGKTWQPMQIIVKAVPEAAMDPTPIVDRTTGAIVLVYDLWPEYIKDTWPADYHIAPGMDRRSVTAWVMTSNDDGATWSTPVDITAMTKKPGWSRIVHGPGVGIQTRSGRLVVPCWKTNPNGSHDTNFAIFSDDHGKTWQLSDNEVGPGVNESQVVELSDGSLSLNMRGAPPCRKGSVSKDGGKTWSAMFQIPELIDSGCQGSILRYTWADAQGGKSRVLFCNPATGEGRNPAVSMKIGRNTGTIRLSYDEGKTWPVAKMLFKDTFAYSCLTTMPDGTICCLFDDADWTKTTFARFSLEWLTDGKDSIK
jgi:sialidase-1